MPASVLHIVFSTSAAVDLRAALTERDQVISLMDSLSFGPIDPPDGEVRTKWVEEELGYTGWEEVAHEAALFWTEATAPAHRKIVWISRRTTQEYSGFLEWLSRIGEEPFELIDLTDVTVIGRDRDNNPTKPHLAISLGMLPAHQIIENGLIDCAEPITPALRRRYQELWARLRADNSPLRVLSKGELVSAPLTYFDPLLLSHITSEWQNTASVVGNALTDFMDNTFIQAGDLVLAARVRALADMGQLEARGDVIHIRNSEVRRAAPNPHE